MQLDFSTAPRRSPSGPSRGQSLELLRRIDAARLTASAASGYRRIKGQVTARAAALRRPIAWTRKRVMLRDKVAFVLGVFHIIASAYWLGYSPSTFYKLYTVKALLLLTVRLVLYRQDKMHYYLLDFCYYANALMLVHVWALPEACDLQKVRTLILQCLSEPLQASLPLDLALAARHTSSSLPACFTITDKSVRLLAVSVSSACLSGMFRM